MVKNAPRMLSLKSKHHFYVSQLKQLDEVNRILKDRIRLLSSNSPIEKDAAFLALIKRFKIRVEKNCQLREKYRLRVRRLKGTIKEKNRHDFN